jgi:hypothetical protein
MLSVFTSAKRIGNCLNRPNYSLHFIRIEQILERMRNQYLKESLCQLQELQKQTFQPTSKSVGLTQRLRKRQFDS